MKRRSLFNMYFTTTISISLVLFLVGLECVVLMSAHELVRHVRENVVMTIVLNDMASQEDVARLENLMRVAPYCNDVDYISREEALQEHIDNLGEDPQKFLGYNPLTDAFEVNLQAEYAQTDSIRVIEQNLMSLPYVDQVIYQADIVEQLDNNLQEASLILLAVALALLIIALVLISNTIQLQVYSKRFLINTMRLVPSPVPCDDAVGIDAADGQASFRHMRGTICHVPFCCTEVQRHLQVQLGDRQHSEHFALQPIVCQNKTGFFISSFA